MTRSDPGAYLAHAEWLRHHHFELPIAMFQATIYRTLLAVSRDRRTVTLTRHGRPVARLVPLDFKEQSGL